MNFSIDLQTGRAEIPTRIQRTKLSSLTQIPDGIIAITPVAAAGSFNLLPPKIVETDQLNPLYRAPYLNRITRASQDYAPVQLFSFRDAIITSHGVVITRDGKLIDESCWELFANRVVPHNLHQEAPLQFRLNYTSYRRVEGRCILVKRPWWSNFGHWLVDSAALLALLAERRKLSGRTIVIGRQMSPEMRRIVFETLAIVAPDNPILEHPDDEVWQFDHLDYLSPVHMSGEYKVPASLQALRAKIVGSSPNSSLRKRLFISRSQARRKLENIDEIVGIAKEFGFETLQPEKYPLSEQARAFRDAEACIGIKGAAFTNVVFCDRPASMLALSPGDWPDLFFWDICSARGIEYSEIFGPLTSSGLAQGQNTFTIDPAVFRASVAAMLESQNLPRTPSRAELAHGTTLEVAPPATLPELRGAFYQEGLRLLHATLKPKSYLEIGSLTGDTLRLASCPSLAIDVEFRLDSGFPGAIPELHLFQMSSDEFFLRFNPSNIVGPIHLAFLDGMHLFEFLLRDFIAVEQHCSEESTIVLHDCVPLDQFMARRNRLDSQGANSSRHPEWWAGDVWKVPVVLRQYRPDLAVGIFDAPPTGLVIIRKLNPNSRILRSRYDEILETVRSWPDEDFAFRSYLRELELMPTSGIQEFLQHP